MVKKKVIDDDGYLPDMENRTEVAISLMFSVYRSLSIFMFCMQNPECPKRSCKFGQGNVFVDSVEYYSCYILMVGIIYKNGTKQCELYLKILMK